MRGAAPPLQHRPSPGSPRTVIRGSPPSPAVREREKAQPNQSGGDCFARQFFAVRPRKTKVQLSLRQTPVHPPPVTARSKEPRAPLQGDATTMPTEICATEQIALYVPPFRSCTDNAAMIGYVGALALAAGEHENAGLAPYSRDPERRRGRFLDDGSWVP